MDDHISYAYQRENSAQGNNDAVDPPRTRIAVAVSRWKSREVMGLSANGLSAIAAGVERSSVPAASREPLVRAASVQVMPNVSLQIDRGQRRVLLQILRLRALYPPRPPSSCNRRVR